ncbi:DNA topoisomerase I [Aeropyrum pernix]|uniref:DNA topoisomerase I n=1 Tax=Aeropyrum pernix TaxID=56636 RepID=UPI000A9C1D59|nr:DNA topoisomerase I [Aeropyrum pernix]
MRRRGSSGRGRCFKPAAFIAVVAEKPKAAAKIAYALSDGRGVLRCSEYGVPYWIVRRDGAAIVVAPSAGHLFGPHTDSRGFPVFDFEWRPIFEFDRGAGYLSKFYRMLSRILPGASLYVNACDYDIEGSVIGFKIIEAFGDVNRARRMKFSTLAPQDIRRAYARMERLDVEMIEAGMARSEMDWLWGINVSRALMEAARRAAGRRVILSAGRVQSPTLVEAYRRWREINLHVPKASVAVKITAEKGGGVFDARPHGWKPQSLETARSIKSELRKNPWLAVEEVRSERSILRPPPAFNLGDLQKEANRILGLPPLRTQSIAEELYLEALISYPRTNSQKLPPSINYRAILDKLAHGPLGREARELLKETGGVLRPVQGSKDDPAHPAIHPTGEKPSQRLSKEHMAVYELIVRRFLAAFSREAIVSKSSVLLRDFQGRVWRAEGLRVEDLGWLKYYHYSTPGEKPMPPLDRGDKARVVRVDVRVEWSQTPVRLDKASLLRWMESVNIGTEGTRARIIETLYKRGYLEGSRKSEVTPLGEAVAVIIQTLFPELSKPDLTRRFESMIEDIRSGRRTRQEVIDMSKKTISKLLESFLDRLDTAVREIGVSLGSVEVEAACHLCGRKAVSAVSGYRLCSHHMEAFDRLRKALPNLASTISSTPREALEAIARGRSRAGAWVRDVAALALRDDGLYKALL